MSDNSILSRRKALLRIGAFAAAAYATPAVLTITRAHATKGSGGGSGDSGSGGGSGGSGSGGGSGDSGSGGGTSTPTPGNDASPGTTPGDDASPGTTCGGDDPCDP